jgi:hypothetical protein
MRTAVGLQLLPHSRVDPKTASVRPDSVVAAVLDASNGTSPTINQPKIYALTGDEGATIREWQNCGEARVSAECRSILLLSDCFPRRCYSSEKAVSNRLNLHPDCCLNKELKYAAVAYWERQTLKSPECCSGACFGKRCRSPRTVDLSNPPLER